MVCPYTPLLVLSVVHLTKHLHILYRIQFTPPKQPKRSGRYLHFTLEETVAEMGKMICGRSSGGDEIPVELFQILKDDTVKVLHSICQQIWKTQQWPQD